MKRYIKKYTWTWAVLLGLLVLQCVTSVGIQFLKGLILDVAIYDSEKMFKTFAIFIFVTICTSGLAYGYRILLMRNVEYVVRDLRHDLAATVLFQKRHHLKDLNTSAVITRYTSELQTIRWNYLTKGLEFISYVLTIIIVGVSLLRLDPIAAFLAIVLGLLPLVVANAYQKKLSDAEKGFMKENQGHVKLLRDFLHGMEAVKNYGIEEPIYERYAQSLSQLKKKDKQRSVKRAGSNGLSFVCTLFAQFILAVYSAYRVYSGHLSPGNFISIFALSSSLSQPLYWIAKCYETMMSSQPVVDDVIGFIDEHREDLAQVDEQNQAWQEFVNLQDKREDDRILEVQNLSFSHDDNLLISNLNFSMNKGEKILVLGESGSGKSSLVDLLLTYELPQYGQMNFYGFEPWEITVNRQAPFLFEGSLRDNLTLYNPDISDEAMGGILKKLGLGHLIEAEGLDMMIKEGGRNLSGGEAKRISLARAFLHPAPLYILDEPLANIDPENIERVEYLILESEASIMLISHQVSKRLMAGMNRKIAIGG